MLKHAKSLPDWFTTAPLTTQWNVDGGTLTLATQVMEMFWLARTDTSISGSSDSTGFTVWTLDEVKGVV